MTPEVVTSTGGKHTFYPDDESRLEAYLREKEPWRFDGQD